ncbi:hypothetical protein [Tissierella sp. P1]|uniref:hypothetical protein n=1 Tax=Tissierella sp. P1 TaxID=1280483 RepID=UPI0019146CCE|nr:hypothetical protein [Tissierella sp. P1]
MSWEEKTFFGDNITTFSQSKDCTIYRMKDESGDGIMTAIKVFPGITLIYNDFHMKIVPHNSIQRLIFFASISAAKEESNGNWITIPMYI